MTGTGEVAMATTERAVSALRVAFLPAAPGGVAEDLVRRLAGAINLGLLRQGEQLPSEAELAVQMGVSTLTLRGALASLREQGMVETRRGRRGGSFVRKPGSPSPAALRERLAALTVAELRDLCDEQMAVSGAAARLAAQRAGEADLTRLDSLAAAVGTATTLGERSRADSRFHIEFALAAQSQRLTRSEIELQSQIADLLWYPGDSPPDVATIASEHRAVLGAVAAEDEQAARDAAEQHVENGLRRVIAQRLRLPGPPR
jgi:DNA-binding FadR family transcriptional regulator